jgi:hypothetical protein
MQQQVQLDGAERQLGGQVGGGVDILWCVVGGCDRFFVYSFRLRVVTAIQRSVRQFRSGSRLVPLYSRNPSILRHLS